MAQQDKAGIKANGDARWNDNTNEEITPLRNRQMNDDYKDSFAVLNDTASISGDWTFTVDVNVPLLPTADAHAISKKYFDDNASAATGDVTGTSSSILNEIPTYSDTTGKAIQDGSGVGLDSSGNFTSVGNITFSTATKTIAGIEVGNLLDKSISQTVSGGWTFSSNVTVPILPIATTDAASKDYVDGLVSGGDVVKVGTPVNNQLGVWTGDGTLEGDANVTWNGSTFNIGGGLTVSTLATSDIQVLSGVSGNGGTGTANTTNAIVGTRSTANNVESLILRGDTLNDSSVRPVTSIVSSSSGAALTTRPTLAGFNWTTLLWEVSVGGDWDYQGNDLGGIGQATIDNIVIDGNEISSSSGDIDFSPVSATNALVLSATSGDATFGGDIIQSDSVQSQILRANNTGTQVIGSATAASSGGNILLRGGSFGSGEDYAIILRNGGTTALTLNSGDATFSGDVIKTGATEDVAIKDAGSTSATEQDWIEVTVGGNTGYIRVFASK